MGICFECRVTSTACRTGAPAWRWRGAGDSASASGASRSTRRPRRVRRRGRGRGAGRDRGGLPRGGGRCADRRARREPGARRADPPPSPGAPGPGRRARLARTPDGFGRRGRAADGPSWTRTADSSSPRFRSVVRRGRRSPPLGARVSRRAGDRRARALSSVPGLDAAGSDGRRRSAGHGQDGGGLSRVAPPSWQARGRCCFRSRPISRRPAPKSRSSPSRRGCSGSRASPRSSRSFRASSWRPRAIAAVSFRRRTAPEPGSRRRTAESGSKRSR